MVKSEIYIGLHDSTTKTQLFENEKYTKTDINKVLIETQNIKRLSAKMDGYEAVISSKTPLNVACREKIDITIKCLPKGE